MTHVLLLLAAGSLASAMNAMAGGGSFLTLPALIGAGLPSTVANASSGRRIRPVAGAMPKNRYYQGPVSDHFDGQSFFNPGHLSTDRGLGDLLRWRFSRRGQRWPASVPSCQVVPEARVAGIRVTMIGHASLLIQTAGRNLLVDPVWSERASPVTWGGPRRVNPPGVAFESLPPIDAVLLTHNHYDHLDVATLRRVWQRNRPRLMAPLGNDAVIARSCPGIMVETYDWARPSISATTWSSGSTRPTIGRRVP